MLLLPKDCYQVIFLIPDGDVNKIGNVPKYFSLFISAADEKQIMVQNEDREVPKIAYKVNS